MERGIIILDFGSQYTQLIARRIRELGVYSEIYPYSIEIGKIMEMNPYGIVLSGGPSSVLDKDAPLVNHEIADAEVPILGICYGMQLLSRLFGGVVERSTNREYGKALINIEQSSRLFDSVKNESIVWMSHGDSVIKVPDNFRIIAKTLDGAGAAMENDTKNIFAVQFHPEVAHTEEGRKILSNFIFNICKAEAQWSMQDFVKNEINEIREKCGGKKVVLGVSGGVDSTTLAVLANRALGGGVKSIFIDNGLLRKNETGEVLENLRVRLGLKIEYIDASEIFLKHLEGVESPEEKRKIIGKTFIDIFYKALKDFDFLVQGTLYPDVIESNPVKGPSQTIKTHHNRVREVQDLEKQGKILEPFKFLFKDEVREVARILNVPEDILNRHPFPGPGLAVRILGAVNREKLEILKTADEIFINELKKSGWYDKTWQAFAVLLPVRSVGVMGDERAYGRVIALRAVASADAMTANWARIPHEILDETANRIVRQIKGVNRVVYDITSKPPATIEWE